MYLEEVENGYKFMRRKGENGNVAIRLASSGSSDDENGDFYWLYRMDLIDSS